MTKTTEQIWKILQDTVGEDQALHLIETAQAEIRRDAAQDIRIDLADWGETAAVEIIRENYI